jgi:putative transposase
MEYISDIQRRRSIRLKHYDYSQTGAYFVTICSQGKECLFGHVSDGEMVLNDAGRMVQAAWDRLPQRFSAIDLDAFVVMPNHVHGIIIIVQVSPASAHSSVGDIVGAFKSITTHEYVAGIRQQQWPSFSGRLWQRNYYEHIIRSEQELDKTREYITANPLKWTDDENYK